MNQDGPVSPHGGAKGAIGVTTTTTTTRIRGVQV